MKTKIGALVLLLILGIALFFGLRFLVQNQDVRNQASVTDGIVKVTADYQSQVEVGQPVKITLKANTHQLVTNGIQVGFNITGVELAAEPQLQILESSGLNLTYSETHQIAGGYNIVAINLPEDIFSGFVSNNDLPFLEITAIPQAAGNLQVVFLAEDSLAADFESDDPEADQLAHIAPIQIAAIIPSPSPTPSPSPSPIVSSPSPSPVMPTPSPVVASPSPSPVVPTPSPSPSPVAPTPSPSPSVCPPMRSDFNNDCKIDIMDYSIMVVEFMQPRENLRTDLNQDGKVNIMDYSILVFDYNQYHQL